MSDYDRGITPSGLLRTQQGINVAKDPARGALSNEGVKHDQDKPVMALIPALALEEEARVWTFGMTKYGAWNWAKGLAYVRILSAMLRHTVALLRGEDRDPETGLLHAAHVRCCAGMLIEFQLNNRSDLDDRNKENVK